MLDNLHSLTWFWPETILGIAALAVLLADLVAGRPSLRRPAAITFVALGAAACVLWMRLDPSRAFGLFGGLMAKDPLADFFQLLFLGGTFVIAILSLRSSDAVEHTGARRGAEAAELYALLLTTTVGLFLMAAATDLFTAFLGVETVSIMSYILAGFRRRNRGSAEAALKYVIYGGVASGVMLYGLSLLYGLAGSTAFTQVRAACATTPSTSLVLVAVVLCLAGFGYKIASVPFHMWCPDVYQGAPTPVTAFLSVGPKAAGFALLIRFFGAAVPERIGGVSPWPLLLAILAVATMTLGNLAAMGQTNLKRLLAYSSIAQAGYLLLGLAAGTREGTFAVAVYLVTYLFMNVGAFAVVIAVSEAGVGEDLIAWRGLGRRAPGAAVAMALCLFSLTGLPPFAGFFGKYFLFAALVARGDTMMVTLAVIGLLNSAVSLFYYAKVLRAMYFEPAPDETALPIAPLHTAVMWAMAVPSTVLFAAWAPLMRFVDASLVQWSR
jgi:NADH-quinone oxidoreductase subunit N